MPSSGVEIGSAICDDGAPVPEIPMSAPPALRDVRIEVCLESIDGALAARDAGADRIELCADLLEGGTTPSAGALRTARALCPDLGVMAMIRPRGGDFAYTPRELDVMADDVAFAKGAGADGVVFGMLNADGTIDEAATARLVEAARPMQVTFHRAFDMSRDLGASLETLVDLGVDRVLTSGGRASVVEAVDVLAGLVEQAGARIVVMPGCGVMEDNIVDVVTRTGAREIHFAAPGRAESPMTHRNPHCFMGTPTPPGEYERATTDAARLSRFLGELRP